MMIEPTTIFRLIGRDQDDWRVVATEKTDALLTANRIATSWRECGLSVEVESSCEAQAR